MKKILAISGGIDSVVMLDFFRNDPDVVVAHFNHNTRPSAFSDQLFVKKLAKTYKKPFFTATALPNSCLSEAAARSARYDFLRKIAKKEQGLIYTAHHLDDLIESIAINLIRGTNWRGLTPFYSYDLKRPLLEKAFNKKTIYRYAANHHLTFRNDPTNTDENFLRNRLRPLLIAMPEKNKQALYTLWKKQTKLRITIEDLLKSLQPSSKIYQRNWFLTLDHKLAIELLRTALLNNNISLTTPQLNDFLGAIKTYDPHKNFNLPGNIFVHFTKSTFML